MRRRRNPVPAVVACLALAATACGGDGNEQSAPTDADVAVATFRFQPTPVTVERGATVRWTNRDDIEHTVTAGTPETPGTTFDGTLAGPGSHYTHVFDAAGTFAYFCRRHTSMTGAVVVA